MLRLAMSKFFCYATVYQAIELFSLARSEREFEAVGNSMAAMKILGLNPKNARKYGELIASNKRTDRWNVLIAGLCIDSRLPILTERKREFASFKGLKIVPTKLTVSEMTGEEILRHIRNDK